MFDLSDTICAICTSSGTGAIAAIRISGPDSWNIAQKIFSPTQSSLEHMHAIHGYIKENNKTIDEVIILPFKSPKSYTAEDVIEIFCHGGNQIVSMILDLCLRNGARQAKSGEFTFRAFINGRIDLTSAEAINEMIHADTQKAVFSASNVVAGSLKEKVNNFRERLFGLITTLESSIEFPMERDVPDVKHSKIFSVLSDINLELNKLIQSSKEGQMLRAGVRVAIIGAPNAGKSSLLNQLLENQRAIVTSEPGTTRDTIEEKFILDGYPIVLIDTAGLRDNETLAEPEKLGIDRSKFALENSDITLLIFDLTKRQDDNEKEIFELLNGKSKIIVGNKMDLAEDRKQSSIDVCISAKYGTNMGSLKKLLVEKIKSSLQFTYNGTQSKFYINQRQKELLLQCSSHIELAINMSKEESPFDLTSDELKKAVSKIDEVSGRKINDEIITNIFARFCIGK